MMLKRAMKGELDLMGPAMAVSKEIMSIPDFGADEEEGLFLAEKKSVAQSEEGSPDGFWSRCAKIHDETL